MPSLLRAPARLLLLLALCLPLAGCLTVTRTRQLERLEDTLASTERRHQSEVQVLERRIAELERQAREGEAGPGASPLPENDPADPRRFGGTYRQAIATDPPKLDPAHLQDTTSHRIGAQMLEGLVEFDENLGVVPLIAESWELSQDRRTYTFRIRPGVRFHHGREVVAEDFAWSFARVLDPATVSPRTWLFDRILGYSLFQKLRRCLKPLQQVRDGEDLDRSAYRDLAQQLVDLTLDDVQAIGHPEAAGVEILGSELAAFLRDSSRSGQAEGLLQRVQALESSDFLRLGLQAPDPRTFVVRLERPFAPFLSVLAMVNAAVVPREKVEELGEDFGFQPVGTGPFRFVSWKRAVSVELEAFEDYFQGRPYLDRMTFRVIPDGVTRLTEFEVGNLESVNEIPDEKYEEIRDDPDFPGVLVECPTLHVFYIAMNVEKPPFDDLRVRQAFVHAVDPRPIIEKIRKGRGQVARGPIPPGLDAYDPYFQGLDYDPERARELLAEAGYADPSELGVVEFWTNSTSPQDRNSKIAAVFQQYLRDIGVQVELRTVDWGTFLDMVDRGDPAIMRQAWVADYPDADNFLHVLFHSSSIGQGNASRYRDPEVDRWLDQARESPDPSERVELYRRAQRHIVAQAPWIPLYHELDTYMHKPWVRDVVLNGRGPDAVRYKRVWLDHALREKGLGGP